MTSAWVHDGAANEVRHVLLERVRAGSRPGARTDPHTVALCIEGGAMRGVVSAGMITAIERLGILHAFDRVYGSSAGAMNGAYLIAGQAEYGSSIYSENINNSRFISLRRLFGRRPVVDLEFLVRDVMLRDKRLETGRVLASPVTLHVLVTAAESGGLKVLSGFSSDEDLLDALRASATMPVVAGKPWPRGGQRYLDPMLTEPIPLASAEEEGCTHLVLFLTRPPGAAGPGRSLLDRALVLPRLRRAAPHLAAAYERRDALYHAALAQADTGLGPAGLARVLPIRPAGAAVGKLERRADVLRRGAEAGLLAVYEALGIDIQGLVPQPG